MNNAINSMNTVLITGASRGIGYECALTFAKNGFKNIIVTCSKSENELNELISLLNNNFKCNAAAFIGNMGDFQFVNNMYKEIESTYGGVDILINNAGISHIGLLSDMSFNEWHNIINSNLDSVFNCSKFAIPNMVRNQFGKIINISSVWGICGASCETAYSASKGGVNSFTKALAKELAPSNIQVNAIAFGMIDTQMNSEFSDDERQEITSEIPSGRICTPTEAAEFIFRIALSETYLTGQVIQFDGGWI